MRVGRGSYSIVAGLLVAGVVGGVVAAASRGGDTKPSGPPIDLFAAIEADQIEVTVIPSDAKRLTLQVANKQDVPLTIRLPEAFAAIPVLAQFGLPPGLNPGPGQGRGRGNNPLGGPQTPQQLGVAGGQNNLVGGALFNVLPGKIVKQKLACVCLEYGKPDPNPRLPYRLERLETVQPKPELREVLVALSRGACSQRVAQLAAWHLANEMTWQQLAQAPRERLTGKPLYSATEVEQARLLVEQVSEPRSERLASYSQASR